MSNRVEELESQVAELQAAVDGLTEELVETRERLRKLEDDAAADERRRSERVSPAEDEDRTTADGSESTETEPDAAAEAEDESESEPDDDSSGTDEIIVA